MKYDEYDEIYDEEDSRYWINVGRHEPADPEHEPEYITPEDVKNLGDYPCPNCGTQMPNEGDDFFICPKCGSMYDATDIAIDYNEHFA